MTDPNLIKEFMSTPGMVLQHSNSYEYLKNELGATVIYATNHRHEKCIMSISFEKAKDIMEVYKYVPPYACNTDDPIPFIAQEIQDAEDGDCDYMAEDGLLKYLTV